MARLDRFDRLLGFCSLPQLAAAKVSKSNFRPKQRKFRRHFKGAFRTGNMEVRILQGQPGSPAFGQAPQETHEWAGDPGFSCIRFRLWTPCPPHLRLKSPKVSSLLREYSRFRETVGGDGFDQDCRPRLGGRSCGRLRKRKFPRTARQLVFAITPRASANVTLRSRSRRGLSRIAIEPLSGGKISPIFSIVRKRCRRQ